MQLNMQFEYTRD